MIKERDAWECPQDTETFQYGLNYVKYESDMLGFTHSCLTVGFLFKLDRVFGHEIAKGVKNSILESFLLHFRALREFFEKHPNERKEGPSGEDHTVISADYGFGPFGLEWLDKETRVRLNKDLAHIDYDRREREQKGKEWPTNFMFKKMMEALKLFEKHIKSLDSAFPATRNSEGKRLTLK